MNKLGPKLEIITSASNFLEVGTRVDVFYDGDFHLGQVAAIHSEDSANVNFMERLR